ncbi:MAG: hypothetical protein E7361_02880 [Clostridiales bacterium]|nr:hypothetical protein [Clostridiales bacterium]
MSFKDYCKSDISKKETIKNVPEDEGVVSNVSVEEKYEKYSKLSKEELMAEFVKESRAVKDKGGYSSSQIDMMKNILFPHLSEEQKIYFESLIGMVK